MRVIYKAVGEAPKELIIDGMLSSMQTLVGGYIEPVQLTKGVVMACGENGAIKGKQPNITLRGQYICGDVFFCGSDGEVFTDCPESVTGINMILEELR